LRERLARQEAAARLFDPRKPEPAPKPAPKPEAAPKAAPTAKPAAAAPATAAAKPAAPPTPAPAAATTTTAPAKAATPGAPAKAAPPVPVPQPAAAKAAPPSAPAPSRLVSRVNPEFPREAAREGYDRGLVKVRMTLAADGSVTKVDVLESNPRRVFDREVTRALSQWKFSAGAAGRAVETEIEFTR
jgi:protein TonB